MTSSLQNGEAYPIPDRAHHPPRAPAPFVLASEEWVALPRLGLPVLKARIDTGAATSALAATAIERFEVDERPHVRFLVRPVPGRDDIRIACEALLLGRRWVTSSNGERELRPLIETEIELDGRRWPIRLTLTERKGLNYRMLLGRQAMLPDMVVEPKAAARTPSRGFDVYEMPRGRQPARSPLTLGLLGRGPFGPLWQPLADAALRRGHQIVRIDVADTELRLGSDGAAMSVAGRRLQRLDGVHAAFGPHPTAYELTLVRHLEDSGVAMIHAWQAMAAAGDPYTRQALLARSGIACAQVVLSGDQAGGDGAPADAVAGMRSQGGTLVTLVDRTVDAIVPAGRKRRKKRTAGAGSSATRGLRRLAIEAARTVGMRHAEVEVAGSGRSRHVVAMAPLPCQVPPSAAAAEAVIALLEVKAVVRRLQA